MLPLNHHQQIALLHHLFCFYYGETKITKNVNQTLKLKILMTQTELPP